MSEALEDPAERNNVGVPIGPDPPPSKSSSLVKGRAIPEITPNCGEFPAEGKNGNVNGDDKPCLEDEDSDGNGDRADAEGKEGE